MKNLSPEAASLLVACVFALALAGRSIVVMLSDTTPNGAPEGYERPDNSGVYPCLAGCLAVFAVAWIIPMVVGSISGEGGIPRSMLWPLGSASATVAVVPTASGIYIKYLSKDFNSYPNMEDGERTTWSVPYTIIGALLGCVGASCLAAAA